MPKNDVVVALGLQRAYLDPDLNRSVLIPCASEFKRKVLEFLVGWKKSPDRKLILVRDVRNPLDPFYKGHRTECETGSEGVEAYARFKALSDLTLNASKPDGTHGTSLLYQVQRLSPGQVYLIGVPTPSIMLTATSLAMSGVEVQVLEPLCASKDDYIHNASINLLANHTPVSIKGGTNV